MPRLANHWPLALRNSEPHNYLPELQTLLKYLAADGIAELTLNPSSNVIMVIIDTRLPKLYRGLPQKAWTSVPNWSSFTVSAKAGSSGSILYAQRHRE